MFEKKTLPLLIAAALTAGAASTLAAPASDSPESVEAPAEARPYRVTVKDWEGPVGEEGYVILTVEAVGAHKINAKYPQRLTLDAPPSGLSLPLRKLKRSDAQMSGEKKLIFTVPATPTKAGAYRIAGKIRLSVCNDAQCLIEKQPFSANITAQ